MNQANLQISVYHDLTKSFRELHDIHWDVMEVLMDIKGRPTVSSLVARMDQIRFDVSTVVLSIEDEQVQTWAQELTTRAGEMLDILGRIEQRMEGQA